MPANAVVVDWLSYAKTMQACDVVVGNCREVVGAAGTGGTGSEGGQP